MKQRSNRSKSLSLLALMPLVGGFVLSNIESKDTPMSLTSNLGTSVRSGIKLTADKKDRQNEDKTFKTSEPVDATGTLNQSESVNTETKCTNQVSDEVTAAAAAALKSIFLRGVDTTVYVTTAEALQNFDATFGRDGFMTPDGLINAYVTEMKGLNEDASLVKCTDYVVSLDNYLEVLRKRRLVTVNIENMLARSMNFHESLYAELAPHLQSKSIFLTKGFKRWRSKHRPPVESPSTKSEGAGTLIADMGDTELRDYAKYVQTSLMEIPKQTESLQTDIFLLEWMSPRVVVESKNLKLDELPPYGELREGGRMAAVYAQWLATDVFFRSQLVSLLPADTMMHQLILRKDIRPPYFLKRKPDKPEWYQTKHIPVTDKYKRTLGDLQSAISCHAEEIEKFIQTYNAPKYIGSLPTFRGLCPDIIARRGCSAIIDVPNLYCGFRDRRLCQQCEPLLSSMIEEKITRYHSTDTTCYTFLREEELNKTVVQTENTLPPDDSTCRPPKVRKLDTGERKPLYFYPNDSCPGDRSWKKGFAVTVDEFVRNCLVFSNLYRYVIKEGYIFISANIPAYLKKYENRKDTGYLPLLFIRELADCDFDLEKFNEQNPVCKDSPFNVEQIEELQCLIINETNTLFSNFPRYIKELEKCQNEVENEIGATRENEIKIIQTTKTLIANVESLMRMLLREVQAEQK